MSDPRSAIRSLGSGLLGAGPEAVFRPSAHPVRPISLTRYCATLTN